MDKENHLNLDELPDIDADNVSSNIKDGMEFYDAVDVANVVDIHETASNLGKRKGKSGGWSLAAKMKLEFTNNTKLPSIIYHCCKWSTMIFYISRLKNTMDKIHWSELIIKLDSTKHEHWQIVYRLNDYLNRYKIDRPYLNFEYARKNMEEHPVEATTEEYIFRFLVDKTEVLAKKLPKETPTEYQERLVVVFDMWLANMAQLNDKEIEEYCCNIWGKWFNDNKMSLDPIDFAAGHKTLYTYLPLELIK